MDSDLILPASYDIAWTVVTIATLAALAVAVVKWARTDFTSPWVQLAWFALILAVPIIGPVAFLLRSPIAPRSASVDEGPCT